MEESDLYPQADIPQQTGNTISTAAEEEEYAQRMLEMNEATDDKPLPEANPEAFSMEARKANYDKKNPKTRYFNPKIRHAWQAFNDMSPRGKQDMIDAMSEEQFYRFKDFDTFARSRPIERMHPTMNNTEGRNFRDQLEFNTSDPAERARAIEARYPDLDAAADPSGRVRIQSKGKFKGETYVLDPSPLRSEFEWGEVRSDFGDLVDPLTQDLLSTQAGLETGSATGAAAKAAARLFGRTGSIVGPLSTLAGWAAGGYGAGYLGEAGKQELGMMSGSRTQRQPELLHQAGKREAITNLAIGPGGVSDLPISGLGKKMLQKSGATSKEMFHPMRSLGEAAMDASQRIVGGPSRTTKDLMFKHYPELKEMSRVAEQYRSRAIKNAPKPDANIGHLQLDSDMVKRLRTDAGDKVKRIKTSIHQNEIQPALLKHQEAHTMDMSDFWYDNNQRIRNLEQIKKSLGGLNTLEEYELGALKKAQRMLFKAKGEGEVWHDISSKHMNPLDLNKRKRALASEQVSIEKKLEPTPQEQVEASIFKEYAEAVRSRLNTDIPGFEAANSRYERALNTERLMVEKGILEPTGGITREKAFLDLGPVKGKFPGERDKPDLRMFQHGPTGKDKMILEDIHSGGLDDIATALDELGHASRISVGRAGTIGDQVGRVKASQYLLPNKNLSSPPEVPMANLGARGLATAGAVAAGAAGMDRGVGYLAPVAGITGFLAAQSKPGQRLAQSMGQLGRKMGHTGKLLRSSRPIQRQLFKENAYPWTVETAPKAVEWGSSKWNELEDKYFQTGGE